MIAVVASVTYVIPTNKMDSRNRLAEKTYLGSVLSNVRPTDGMVKAMKSAEILNILVARLEVKPCCSKIETWKKNRDVTSIAGTKRLVPIM